MPESFWLLVFIFFVVAPILERVLKGGTRPPPQSRRGPQQRAPRPRGEMPRTQQQRPRSTEGQTAADVLPPELWELLTGQKPPARVPPSPEPASQWDEEADHDEDQAAAARPALPAPAPPDEEKEAAELVRRRREAAYRPLDRPLPKVVSMETALPSAAARHKQFHRKIDKPDPKTAAPEMEAPKAARNIIADILRDGTSVDVRRAILMQEVLGPPKGLE